MRVTECVKSASDGVSQQGERRSESIGRVTELDNRSSDRVSQQVE